jgi:hypothetical protein
MKTVKGVIHTGYAGCTHEIDFEIDDEATDSEIGEYLWEEVYNHISVSWEIEKD